MKARDVLTTEEMRRLIAEIAHEHRLRLVVLYGSVARGTETKESDVDMGILGEAPLSYEDEWRITEALARASGLPKVEVRSLHRVAPLFLQRVMREGIVLYADTPERARALSLYAWKLAAETRPLREARYASVRARIS